MLLWPVNGTAEDPSSLVRTFHEYHHPHRKDADPHGTETWLQVKQVDYIFNPQRFWKGELRQLCWLGGVYTNIPMMKQRRRTFLGVKGPTVGLARFLPVPAVGCGFKRFLDMNNGRLLLRPWGQKSKAWVASYTGPTGLFEIWKCFPGTGVSSIHGGVYKTNVKSCGICDCNAIVSCLQYTLNTSLCNMINQCLL